jgi:hypothetical protein
MEQNPCRCRSETEDDCACGRQSRETWAGQGPGGARLVSYLCECGHFWFRVEPLGRSVTKPLARRDPPP